MAIPGIYEVLQEELNNEAIDRMADDAEGAPAEEEPAPDIRELVQKFGRLSREAGAAGVTSPRAAGVTDMADAAQRALLDALGIS